MVKYSLKNITDKKNTVILANGQFPSNYIPKTVLFNSSSIICCDGAVQNIKDTTLKPSAIVGDCDSVPEWCKEGYSDIIFKDPDQDTNDLTKAVHYCIDNGIKDVVILGATGKRDDHSIANISLLAEYIRLLDNVCIMTDYGIFFAIENTKACFESYKGQQISLISISPCHISVQNMQFSYNKRFFDNWWQSTLNQSLSDEVFVETDGRILVFQLYEK